jgi:hypothetical protein
MSEETEFYWPISWSEHKIIRDDFISNYATLSRAKNNSSDLDSVALSILSMEIVQEYLKCWFVTALEKRVQEQIKTGNNTQIILSDFVFDTKYDHNRLEFLKSRFKSSAIRSCARPLYGVIERENYSWRWPFLVNFSNNIVATDKNSLVTNQARQLDKSIALVSFRYWFGECCSKQNLKKYSINKNKIDEFIDLSMSAAGLVGDKLNNNQLKYLASWIEDASSVVKYYLEYLLKNRHKLPKTLWTGSGGYIFRRILHMAVRLNGGTSISHDHGSGLGCFNIIDTNLTEFVTPDIFVTFSESQKLGYEKQFNNRFKFCDSWPEIKYIENNYNNTKLDESEGNYDNKSSIKNIIFVSNQLRGMHIPLTPIEFDHVAIDWQHRLFARLKKMGFNIIYKGHPDSYAKTPEYLAKDLSIQISDKPYEEIMNNGDLIIYDYLHSSTLQHTLKSNLPVLYIDFGHCPLNQEADVLIKKRIQFVDGWHDDFNRCQINWDELESALINAQNKVNENEFVNSYFNRAL